ncbi:MAG: DEAD/DEAH box helicase family protein, partial [Nanoarchaeota archaeon]
MPAKTKTGTREIPLEFAKLVTEEVNRELETGSLFEKVSPITKELLTFWNPNGNFAEVRTCPNFHKGQWQAILNTIYIHEVLKIKNVQDMYSSISPELLTEMDFFSLKKEKHEHPKYCIKMATGTGKTWVMHAILIWQYLNTKYEEEKSDRFSKNFLLVAPGLIVYERLLDAYLGKQKEDKTRDFETSDIKKFEELFIPPNYRQEVLGFVQSSVVKKEEIGKRDEGMIAITNWHILSQEVEEQESIQPLESPDLIVKKLLPKTPGTTAGHSLDVLDNEYFRGKQIEFLANLKNLVMFNDEAHHVGGDDSKLDLEEKQWQNAIIEISKNKKDKFLQVDFSATPYTVKGSGQSRTRHFFPHIITNFELKEAIHLGLVKIVAIDKRKGEGAENLDFKAEREDKNVVSLSGGQRMMLKAGLSKLRILEESFTNFDKTETKHPKMLIVCEDTKVVPFVRDFLRQEEGFAEDELMEIHSTKKGEVTQGEWADIKQKLFSMDKNKNPRVIISVLMLREGFDVNNICVIVPLRSSTSFILLEQVIGRGLRLMWRGNPQYDEMREKNRINLLKKRIEPDNYMDLLYII